MSTAAGAAPMVEQSRNAAVPASSAATMWLPQRSRCAITAGSSRKNPACSSACSALVRSGRADTEPAARARFFADLTCQPALVVFDRPAHGGEHVFDLEMRCARQNRAVHSRSMEFRRAKQRSFRAGRSGVPTGGGAWSNLPRRSTRRTSCRQSTIGHRTTAFPPGHAQSAVRPARKSGCARNSCMRSTRIEVSFGSSCRTENRVIARGDRYEPRPAIYGFSI